MARAFNLTAQLNLRGPANIRSVVSNLRRQLSNINVNVNVNIAGGASRAISGLNTRLRTLNQTLANTTTNVNQVTTAINAMAAAMRGIPTTPIVPPGLPAATRNITQARSEMEEFGRQTGLAIRRFAAFSIGTAGIYALVNAVRDGVTAFIAFDKEMIRLQQVTGESENSLQRVAGEITNLSKNLGVASSELMNVATTLAQAGLSAKDTEKALKALALSSLAPSFDDMNQTVEGSIALMKQFGISASELEKSLGSINAVAAKFAVESSDIIAAIQRTGGVFAAASRGVSEGTDALNEFVAVFTSVRATTRESAETIATGLRTIFTRIQRGGTIEALKEFGINLTDAEGKFVGAYKAVELLSQGLSRLDPRNLKFSQIVEELGGFRQIGKVIPLIQEFATAQQALAVAQKGGSSLAEDAATAQLSLANQLSKVREQFLALFREIGGSDTFQNMAKATLSLASGLIKIAEAAKGVLPVIGAIMAVRGLQGVGQFASGFGAGFRRRASGGRVGYDSGGMVDVALMPGEAVLFPREAKRVGSAKLKRLNYADKHMAKGGVAQVPGQGRSDSFYTQLPAGSFVIRKDATSALGMKNINDIAHGKQKLAVGGMTKVPLPKKLSTLGTKAKSLGGRSTYTSSSDAYPGYYKIVENNVVVADGLTELQLSSVANRRRFQGRGSGFWKELPGDPQLGSWEQVEMAALKMKRKLGGNIQKFGGGSKQPLRQKMSFEDRVRSNMETGKTKKGGRSIYDFGVAALRWGTPTETTLPLQNPVSGTPSKNLASPFKIPGDKKTGKPGRIGRFQIGTLSTSGLDNVVETKLTNGFISSVESAARAMAPGANIQKKPHILNRILKGTGFQTVVGNGLEAALAMMGSPYIDKTEKIKMFDFPKGLGSKASLFNINPNIPTDVTRTIGGFGKSRSTLIDAARRFVDALDSGEFTKAREARALAYKKNKTSQMKQIPLSSEDDQLLQSILKSFPSDNSIYGRKELESRYKFKITAKNLRENISDLMPEQRSSLLREIAASLGSKLGRNANVVPVSRGKKTRAGAALGGEIPIVAQKGEYIINKKSAQSIGYNNLHAMNKYHSGGIIGDKPQKFALGGIPSAIGGALSRILSGLNDTIRRFSTTIARVPAGGGWLGGSRIPGMPATGSGTRATQRAAHRQQQADAGDNNRRSSGLQNSAFALSMALPVMAEMFSGQDEPTSAAGASNKAFAGSAATGIGAGLAIASMGGWVGPIGGIAAAGVGLVKAFADAENAARDFAIQSNTDKMNSQLELTSKSLEKFAKDIDNVDQRSRALSDVLLSITKAEDVSASSQKRKVGLFNLADTGQLGPGATESQQTAAANAAYERSIILFNQGIMSYLSTLSFLSDATGAAAARADLFSKEIPKLSKERSAQFAGSAQASTTFLETEIKRTGTIDALKENEDQYKKITRSLALADAQVQEQIMLIQNNNTLGQQAKDELIKNVIARAGETKAIEIANRAMREKAIDDLNKAASRASFSLERMFTELEQSINASSFAIEKLAQQSELSAAALSGQARIGNTQLGAINVLQNPRAYSSRKNNMAASLGGSAFGSQLSEAMRGLLLASSQLEDTIMSTINETLVSTPKDELNNEMIAARISRAVRVSLDRLKLPPELANKLSNEVGKSLEELRKSGEDKVDFSELMDKIPALSKVVESAKRAQEVAIQALENWQKALNEYSNSFNKIMESQIQNNQRLRQSADILYNGQVELSKAFGGQTNLRGVINNFRANISSLSGGFTSVGDISANIQRLEQIRQDQQALQSAAGERGPEGQNAFMMMTSNLAKTNAKLRESYNALEQLSQNTDVASAAMARISELQMKQQAGLGIMEKIVTSTPEDLTKLGDAFARLQANMSGIAVGGGSAEQRGQTLEAFNMIAPLLGERQGAIKANVLESMFREMNAPLTPFFRNILDSLRNPQADPQMNDAIAIYRDSLRQQISANTALNNITNLMKENTAQIAAQQLKQALQNTTLNFENRQLKNIADGINDLIAVVKEKPPGPARLAHGGVVYADDGTFVPRGTDTVPAMLTPGEFVVNRSSTRKNLPLLQSINSGTNYLADGGIVYDLKNQSNAAIGGNAYDKTKSGYGNTLQTSSEFVDISPDLDNKVINKKISVGFIKPALYASATTEAKPLSGFTDIFMSLNDQVSEANHKIPTLETKFAVRSPIGIEADLHDWTQQKTIPNPNELHNGFSVNVLTPDTINELYNAKKNIMHFKDNKDAQESIRILKKRYTNALYYLSQINKNGNEYEITDHNSAKHKFQTTLSQDSLPKFNPIIKAVGDSKVKLENIGDISQDLYGPILPEGMGATGELTNPLGFAQATAGISILPGLGVPLGSVTRSAWRFTIAAGANNIGGFDSANLAPASTLGRKIYAPYKAMNNFSIDRGLANSFEHIQSIKDAINESDKNLNMDILEEDKQAIGNREAQVALSDLYNKKIFSKLFTSDQINIKKPTTLYNIHDDIEWRDLVKDSESPPDSYAKNVRDFYRIEKSITGNPGTTSKKFPWTTTGFKGEDILAQKEEQFKKANERVQSVEDIDYNKNGIKFLYKKIKGPLYDSKARTFEDNIRNFIVVPLGDQTKYNPFGEKLDFSKVSYFKNETELDALLQPLIQKIKNANNDNLISKIRIGDHKNITKTLGLAASSYGPKTIENAFNNDSINETNWGVPKFAEAYKKLLTDESIKGFGDTAVMPGMVDVRGRGRAAANWFRDFITGPNLSTLTSNTVLEKDNKKLLATLRFGLPKLDKPRYLKAYIDRLDVIKKTIPQLPNFVTQKTIGKGEDAVTVTKVNEKYAKLLARVGTTQELLQTLDSGDITKVAKFAQVDPLNTNTNNIIQLMIQRVKDRSLGFERNIIANSEIEDLRNQQVDLPLEDLLKDPEFGMETADVDSTGKIVGYNKMDPTKLPATTMGAVSRLAFNPYNYFKISSRKKLIDPVIDAILDEKDRKQRKFGNKPGNKFVERTLQNYNDLMSNMRILSSWLEFHDNVIDFQPDQDWYASITNLDARGVRNSLSDAFRDSKTAVRPLTTVAFLTNRDNINRAKSSYEFLTNGDHGPLPLYDSNNLTEPTILSLLSKRLHLKNKAPQNQEAVDEAGQPVAKAKGGVVYASTGKLIDFKPKGSDTVPAMLTPGEFVVNRAATQQNLPLLQAINSGSTAVPFSNGGVVYLQFGGLAEPTIPPSVFGQKAPEIPTQQQLFGLQYMWENNLKKDKDFTDIISKINVFSDSKRYDKYKQNQDKLNKDFKDKGENSKFRGLFKIVDHFRMFYNESLTRAQSLITRAPSTDSARRERIIEQYEARTGVKPAEIIVQQELDNARLSPVVENEQKKPVVQPGQVGVPIKNPRTGELESEPQIAPKLKEGKKRVKSEAQYEMERALWMFGTPPEDKKRRPDIEFMAYTESLGTKLYGELSDQQKFNDLLRIETDPKIIEKLSDYEKISQEYDKRNLKWYIPVSSKYDNERPGVKRAINSIIENFINKQDKLIGVEADYQKDRLNSRLAIDMNSFYDSYDGENKTWDPFIDQKVTRPTDEKNTQQIKAKLARDSSLFERYTNIINNQRMDDEKLSAEVNAIYLREIIGGDINIGEEDKYVPGALELNVVQPEQIKGAKRATGIGMGVYKGWDYSQARLDYAQRQSYNKALEEYKNSYEAQANNVFGSVEQDQLFTGPVAQFNKGGLIYASGGTLIPYSPRGTDTVPAMLTPGEFVVNKSATQQNLPLLQAINNGISSYSNGGVVYASDGMLIRQQRQRGQNNRAMMLQARAQAYQEERERRRSQPLRAPRAAAPQQPRVEVQQQQQQQQQQQVAAPQITVSPEAQNFLTQLQKSIGEEGFGKYIGQLEKLSTTLPKKIDFQVVGPSEPIQIQITGAAVLEQLQKDDYISKIVTTEVNRAVSKIWKDTGGETGSPSR